MRCPKCNSKKIDINQMMIRKTEVFCTECFNTWWINENHTKLKLK